MKHERLYIDTEVKFFSFKDNAWCQLQSYERSFNNNLTYSGIYM